MKILITGANGQLGSEICRVSTHENYGAYLGNYEDIEGTQFTKLDITDRDKFLEIAKKIRPDWIIHCAAMTNVDLCEVQRDAALAVNVDGTRNAIDASKAVGTDILYVSTDFIFDGKKGYYKEDDVPNPLNFYGDTKLAGERLVGELDKHLIIRPSVIYSKRKGNFFSWALESLKNGEARVVTDQINSPTLNTELAECILELVCKGVNGVYNTVGDERISRYDFVKRVANVFNFDDSRIIPIRTNQLNQKAVRPADSSLDTTKIKGLGIKFSNVENALKKIKKQIETD